MFKSYLHAVQIHDWISLVYFFQTEATQPLRDDTKNGFVVD